MISVFAALVCGGAAVVGILTPGTWPAGIALTAFACGLHTAIALTREQQ